MAKKLNCHQETTGTEVFYAPKQFALPIITWTVIFRGYLEADSIFALAFTDKMAKKLNCHQETTGTAVFYAPKQFALPIITWTVIFRG